MEYRMNARPLLVIMGGIPSVLLLVAAAIASRPVVLVVSGDEDLHERTPSLEEAGKAIRCASAPAEAQYPDTYPCDVAVRWIDREVYLRSSVPTLRMVAESRVLLLATIFTACTQPRCRSPTL